MPKAKESILVICAHSDDQILGPGATIAKYAKEGKDVYTIILSYGTSALPWLKENIAIKTRIKEAKCADKVIGGKGVQFFNLLEGKFIETLKETKADKELVKIFKKLKPSKIFIHSFEDPHPDHRAAYEIVQQLIKQTKLNPDIFLFDVWNPITLRKSHLPKMYVDVTDTFKLKLKALKCFPSQWSSMLSLMWSVYTKALVHGFHIHKHFAERFFKIK